METIGFQQPTIDGLIAYYRALPKREKRVATCAANSCLIATPVSEGTKYVAVYPQDRMLVVDGVDYYLDAHLAGVARYFDGYDPDMDIRPVSNGACVRILERYKRRHHLT